MALAPTMASALRMNWSSEPWAVRPVVVAAVEASTLVTTLKLKPKSTSVTVAPVTTTRAMCSAVVSAEASSPVAPSWPA